jgi:hypothetical protein
VANVTVVRMSGTYSEAIGLCKSLCDCYVSLHRAEGLGMGPMEAMMMAKPVIMTGWSGNMSYASPQGACLVPYEFSAPSGLDAPQYDRLYCGTRTWWAEPDIKVAAFWMQKIALDPEFCGQMARRGFEQISAYVQEAGHCGFVSDLENLRLLKQGGGLTKPDLRSTSHAMKRAQRRNWGLRLLDARRALIKNVPGAWRLF